MAQAFRKYGQKARRWWNRPSKPPTWKGILHEHHQGRISNKQMLGGIAAAAKTFQNPISMPWHVINYMAGGTERDLVNHFLDSKNDKYGGPSTAAIIPGSDMAYGKRKYGATRRRFYGARSYSKSVGKRRVYGRRPAYKKRVGGYKKKTNPTLSLILKGLRNMN